MPSTSNLQRLLDAGYPIKTPLPAEYEQAIEDMSVQEVEALISAKERLEAAEQKTEPHVPSYVFFIPVPH